MLPLVGAKIFLKKKSITYFLIIKIKHVYCKIQKSMKKKIHPTTYR